jgi:SanA protein
MKFRNIRIRQVMIGFILFALLGAILALSANWYIESYSGRYVYDDIEKVPYNEVGLVLGTSKKLRDGRNNLYFKYRVTAAARLFKAGKIKYLLLSGDNSEANYNEPNDLKNALMSYGVPENRIYLDFAGFRTLDSVVRGHKIFNQSKFTVISQEFHNKRAIFIAQAFDIQAIGFNARDVNFEVGFKTRLREIFARLMVFVDIYLLNSQPKFLGEKIFIGEKK